MRIQPARHLQQRLVRDFFNDAALVHSCAVRMIGCATGCANMLKATNWPTLNCWPITSRAPYQSMAALRSWVIDSLLAATAEQHGLTLVTRNLRDVKGLAVQVINPWAA